MAESDPRRSVQKTMDGLGRAVNHSLQKLKTSPEYAIVVEAAVKTASDLKDAVEAFSEAASQVLTDPESVNWNETAADLAIAFQAFRPLVISLGLAVTFGGDIFWAVAGFCVGFATIAEAVEKMLVLQLQRLQNELDEETLARFRTQRDMIFKHLHDFISLMHKHGPEISIVVGGLVFAVGTALLGWPVALKIAGFGAHGPVKYSLAAWAQRHFWRTAVKRGSIFAYLQSITMQKAKL
ncbi:hypothetical protein BOTBODRAFT_33692 [Botryobasidium botryosum FD-172 SS1]|uniref:Uncharacterized protein n=1 Tax=Botryobasidium botryosum (strain FD-172 SS1) TaxID=930990 RepID=A0A067MFD1_BOTB1|nr:hypothetical protein BOTBODRAFT_33692 [Botryobasidium botryosum FD-172 SS1]